MKLQAWCLALALVLGPIGVAAQVIPAEKVSPAQINPQISALSRSLRIDEAIDVMRAEGIAYGAEMEAEMFPDQGGAGWQATVDLIYDPSVMRARFDTALGAALDGSPHLADITTFFDSDLGRRVLMLEIEARRAMLEEAVEEAAALSFSELEAEGDPRVALLQDFVETNDLIESNVMGALNASLAFYRGLAEGAVGGAMPEDQMLAEVWATEPDMRAETVAWVFPYLALAYRPLPDDDLRAYTAFSASPAGKAVNSALFAAFDAVFVAVSRDLGRAAATQMQGQKL